MMYCSYCGKQVDEEANFCSNCGKNLQIIQQNNIQSTPANPVSNGMAIAGFVLGLLGLLTSGYVAILQILGLIFSIHGLKKATLLNGRGKGLAIAGLILSIISLVIFALYILMFILGMIFVESPLSWSVTHCKMN